MPCCDPGPIYNTDPAVEERLHRATRVACELANIVKGFLPRYELSIETKKWILEHKALDQLRALKGKVKY